ncbi:DUF1501 domain-containing protein [Luteolibacter luteus]|uniref:DUF1501 domain-containing protein n=1 Tax=Luteolibacter luteus TaxID=2728835 RepID=A0A858RIQ8_9BACT|nr:DUF1501 domain-containing protein [Luteolibacter luteus]QJE96309.1 DUF1501 domain-containing protein [Luteolibacter luteus]
MNRRRFLGQASCSAVSAIPVLNTLLNLRLASSIANAAPPQPGEYRALVCLFMSGGNDSFNMLSPLSGPSATHANARAEYENSRGNLALPLTGLHEIHPQNTPGRTFAVHPSMPKLAARFETGDAAFVANVGTLIEPVLNRGQVNNASKRLPLGLYSHSDQIEQWQTSVPQSRSGIGWGGRMMDLIKDINPNQLVSMNISMDGSNVFQSGVTGAEYAVKPSISATEGGAQALLGYAEGYSANNLTDVSSAAVDSMLARQYSHLLQQTVQQKRRDAQDAYAIYHEATLGTLPGSVDFRLVANQALDLPANRLGQQLHQVAKAIMGRSTMGALRQTFFVNLGGWDHHSNTLAEQEWMLRDVDDAIGAFWDQLALLGVQDQVTLFTGSDFGRTLTSNDQGSDHAWGGNHFIMGGAVDGRKIFGQYPGLALNPEGNGAELNPLDTGRGRMIPTTSCDEYFGELALWLGVPPSSLHLVLPNVGNFFTPGATGPLGFFG